MLEAVFSACDRHERPRRAAHVAPVLTRQGAVLHLVAAIPEAVPHTAAAGAQAVHVRTGVAALLALHHLLDALNEGVCACCNGGPTAGAVRAVVELVKCGAPARLAALLQGRSNCLAFGAVICAYAAFESVATPRVTPALSDVLTSRECLESALYLALGEPQGIDADTKEVQMPLKFLCMALRGVDGAAARLAAVPSAMPLLLLAMEPAEAAKTAEAAYPLHRLGEPTSALQLWAAQVVCELISNGGLDAVTPEYAQPLLLNALHMVLGAADDLEIVLSIAAGVLEAAAQAPEVSELLDLAHVVPAPMLRALCARAAGASGAAPLYVEAALRAASALARCSAENASLLRALLPRDAPEDLLGDGLAAAMSDEDLARLERGQRKWERRAHLAHEEKAYRMDAASAGQLAAAPLLNAALDAEAGLATTVRARFAHARAAGYAAICARAPLLGQVERARDRRTWLSVNRDLRGHYVEARPLDLGDDLTAEAYSFNLPAFTLGDAPELVVRVEAALGLDAEAATCLAYHVASLGAYIAVKRAAAFWGCAMRQRPTLVDAFSRASQHQRLDWRRHKKAECRTRSGAGAETQT